MSTLMDIPDQDGSELVSLLVTIQSIVKNISAAVRRAAKAETQRREEAANSGHLKHCPREGGRFPPTPCATWVCDCAR